MNAILLEPTTVDTMVVQCENYSKHGIPTGWFASREFKLNDDELNFMNHLSREDQKRIWKIHFDTGRCVPCMIDEWRDSNKFPSVTVDVPAASRVLGTSQQKDIEKELAAVYGEFHFSNLDAAALEKVYTALDQKEDSVSIVQRLIQLIRRWSGA